MTNKIVFTGGSTAGHIIPNIPLVEEFERKGWEVSCFILGNKLEQTLLGQKKINLYTISAGKFRRYTHPSNFTDLFKIIKGIAQCSIYIHRVRPNVIFSKGGYIAVPVAIAAWLNRIPFIIHESDTIPSLTTKMVYPMASYVCTGFPTNEKLTFLGFRIKTKYTGIPLRNNFIKKKQVIKPRTKKHILLVLGGSLGSTTINSFIRSSLKMILKHFTIIHICGYGKIDQKLKNLENYHQYEFVGNNILGFLNEASLVVSRGGATFLYELLYLKKPALIIPLSKKVSRGDQISNAQYFKNKGFGDFVLEENLTHKNFIEKILYVQKKSKYFIKNMSRVSLPDSKKIITELIINTAKP